MAQISRVMLLALIFIFLGLNDRLVGVANVVTALVDIVFLDVGFVIGFVAAVLVFQIVGVGA